MAEDDERAPDALRQLAERLDQLERLLRQNTQRLDFIERRLPAAPPAPAMDATDATTAPPPSEPRRTPTPKPSAQSPSQMNQAPPASATGQRAGDGAGTPPVTFRYRRDDSGAQSARANSASDGAPARAPKRDMESIVGGSWFNWIGIIAITFGVAFFLKYAFENEWIGPGARVLLGGATGLGILIAGERLRARGLRQYAYVLSGGGILILYLSVYAAHGFYNLTGSTTAFLLMVAVTAAAVALSVRLDALPIAVLGLVGGFLTPVLLSTGRDNQIGLFGYVALLDAGVLAVAYYKNWRSLNYLSFLSTVLMFLGWMGIHYERAKLPTTIFFLALFFLLYSALGVVHNILKRREAGWLDLCLVSANATFYFGLSYALLNESGYHRLLGSHALLVSAFYVGLHYLTWRLHRADRLLTYGYLGAAATFFTIAIAIQLEQQWVTIAWAIEALALTWIGLRTRTSAPRHAAVAVFAVAVLHWVGWDMPEFAFRSDAAFVPLLNARAFSCAVLVASLGAGAWLYRREGDGLERETRDTFGTLYILTANMLALALLTLDLNDYFERQKWLTARGADGVSANFYEPGRLENTRQFSLSALWTFYGATALMLGIKRNMKFVRYGAMALLVAATIKVCAFDLVFYAAAWHAPLFNQTFAAFALLVAAYWYAARLYRTADKIDEDERRILPVLVVVANVLALVALSAEASGHFQSKIIAGATDTGAVRDLELARQLSLSVIWAIYSGAMLVYGRARDNRLLRLLALLLLGATTLKVFFLDLSSLDRVYRIISFIVLGAILLAVSYLYQKSQQQQRAAEADGG